MMLVLGRLSRRQDRADYHVSARIDEAGNVHNPPSDHESQVWITMLVLTRAIHTPDPRPQTPDSFQTLLAQVKLEGTSVM